MEGRWASNVASWVQGMVVALSRPLLGVICAKWTGRRHSSDASALPLSSSLPACSYSGSRLGRVAGFHWSCASCPEEVYVARSVCRGFVTYSDILMSVGKSPHGEDRNVAGGVPRRPPQPEWEEQAGPPATRQRMARSSTDARSSGVVKVAVGSMAGEPREIDARISDTVGEFAHRAAAAIGRELQPGVTTLDIVDEGRVINWRRYGRALHVEMDILPNKSVTCVVRPLSESEVAAQARGAARAVERSPSPFQEEPDESPDEPEDDDDSSFDVDSDDSDPMGLSLGLVTAMASADSFWGRGYDSDTFDPAPVQLTVSTDPYWFRPAWARPEPAGPARPCRPGRHGPARPAPTTAIAADIRERAARAAGGR